MTELPIHLTMMPPNPETGHPGGLLDLLGSANANGEPSRTRDERSGRCYELAAFTQCLGLAPSGSLLVHGSIFHPEFSSRGRIGHAWLLLPGGDGLMWEPIEGLVASKDAWYKYANAWEERTYSEAVTRRMIVDHGHYGRWHESRYP